jgi:hypothetical protein
MIATPLALRPDRANRRFPMPFRGRPAPVATAVALALLTSLTHAQTSPKNEAGGSVALTGAYQFDTDLDAGGDFGWSAFILSGGLSRQVSPQLSVGLTMRWDYEQWRFSRPAAFGGNAPWDQVNALAFGLPIDWAWDSDLRLGVTPVFEWAYETGASASNAINYGAIASATKIFSPRLVLGAGVGVFRQIDETKVFPFVIVNWQIDERWRLTNPFRAGPAGGAGLELACAINDQWEIAGGGAYRSYRFRLDDRGLAPAGVGENRFFPAFARVTRRMGPQTRLDLYAGVSFGGRLTATDNDGNDVAEDDYSSAPVLGLTFSHRF